jgi:hypothetical protein
MFACIINFMMFTTEGDGTNYGVWINNFSLVAASVLAVGYPIWLYVYLSKNYYDL